MLQYQGDFMTDLERLMWTVLPSPSETSNTSHRPIFDKVAYITKEFGRISAVDIRRLFDDWLASAIQRVGEWSRQALERMDSAVEVALLQQKVWVLKN